MATTAMNTYSLSIIVKEGIHPPVTRTTNGEEIFPGMPVTREGETYPDVCLPDALGDSVMGVAGLLENADIGTVYPTNTEIPIYLCGSAAQIRMYHAANGGSIVEGEILVAQGVEAAGYVESLKKSITDYTAAHVGTILGTQITNFFAMIGRALETHASSGTVTPIKVMLSI